MTTDPHSVSGFIPLKDSNQGDIPFYEDATEAEHGVRGHRTRKSIETLKGEVTSLMGKMGATISSIAAGKFPGHPERYGWRIDFYYGNQMGRTELKCLPLRSDNKVSREGALKQALFIFIMSLEAQYNLRYLKTNNVPFLQDLLVPGQSGKTLVEVLQERNEIPALGQSHDETLRLLSGNHQTWEVENEN